MTTDVTVCIPILWRPHRISVMLAAFDDPRTPVLFLPDETDRDSVRELDALGAAYAFAPPAPAFGVPTFASKINHAYRITSTPFLLYVGDDVSPEAGWWDAALRALRNEGVGVLATDDGRRGPVRRQALAVHGVVRRAYVERFGSASLPDAGPVFFEGYRHWQCDAELSYVARARGAFAYARDSVVRHLAPRSGELDATYALGRSFAVRDMRLRDARCRGWPRAPDWTKDGTRVP